MFKIFKGFLITNMKMIPTVVEKWTKDRNERFTGKQKRKQVFNGTLKFNGNQRNTKVRDIVIPASLAKRPGSWMLLQGCGHRVTPWTAGGGADWHSHSEEKRALLPPTRLHLPSDPRVPGTFSQRHMVSSNISHEDGSCARCENRCKEIKEMPEWAKATRSPGRGDRDRQRDGHIPRPGQRRRCIIRAGGLLQTCWQNFWITR